MKIAIIDVLGLSYDGSTLTKRGLGGSESAVILLSRELAQLGFGVTVFNDCISDGSSPGIYNKVVYKPLNEVEKDYNFDIMIGSRSVASFAPSPIGFKTFLNMPDFSNIQANTKHKVLWMHDTFCDGDNLLEEYVTQGRINEIYTLSDFHTSYVTNCHHGRRRNFEVLKPHVWQTRNGMNKFEGFTDIRNKDPNLFVFNASVTKGLIPLLENIWPEVLKAIPDAKLKVIGGYYKFRDGAAPDEQELKWRELVHVHTSSSVEFTGIIPQLEIAKILKKASFTLYPGAFPETFGISSLESLYYNTPIITCNFGALEETAFDLACYKIDYAIEPNVLFTDINKEIQCAKFVELTKYAHANTYLWQQKAYACNAIKDVAGWDTVALQWKQHLYKVLGLYLPVEEYRSVSYINYQVANIFGRRFRSKEELVFPKLPERRIAVITPMYNCAAYIENCILSVAQQDYNNYELILIDDASLDNTVEKVRNLLESLPDNIADKVYFIHNKENLGALYNQISAIQELTDTTDIIMLLDGDDKLINDPCIFDKYNKLYSEGVDFTYGSMWSEADNIPLVGQPYPPGTLYRQYKFNWQMPYTHLRTFTKKLFSDTFNINKYTDSNGQFYRAGGDNALFYTLIEGAVKVHCVPEIMYIYNDLNPLNDYKVNSQEQTKNALEIINEDNSNSRSYS